MNRRSFCHTQIFPLRSKWSKFEAIFILLPKNLLWLGVTRSGVHYLMETAGIVNVVVNAMALTFILNASWKKRFTRLDKMFGRRLQIESEIDFLWSVHAILCILHHTTSSSTWLEILLMLLVVQLPNLLLVPGPEVNLKCTLLRPAFSSNRTAWKCSYYVSLKMTFGAGTPPCAHRVSLDVWRFLLWHILQLITSIYVSNKMDRSRLFSPNNPMCIFWPHGWSFRSRKVKKLSAQPRWMKWSSKSWSQSIPHIFCCFDWTVRWFQV